MSRRSARLFRGSEFPRWLLLAAIMVVGWVLVVQFVRAKQAAPPPPARQLAIDVPPPIPPDEGIEFSALRDKTDLTPRDNPAYAKLLARARETTGADLAAVSRRELGMAHLVGRPELYRGVPVHIEGHALKVLTYDVGEGLSPGKRLYEAWVITADSMNHPYCLVFEDPPKDLAIGSDLYEPVAFDGYFLKLLRYEAARKGYYTPMLIGRLRRTGPPPSSMPLPSHPGWLGGIPWVIPALAVLMLVSLVRWGFMLRKNFAPARRATTFTKPNDQIDPDSLAEWLNKEEDDPDDEPSGYGHNP